MERRTNGLVREPVDVLVANATPAGHIAKEASDKIPIVMITANALAAGLVPSLARPGGNLTGVSLLMTDLTGKRLELLRNIRPTIHAVAFLGSIGDSKATAFTLLAALTRAREAGRRDAARPARSAWSVQRQLAAQFDGEVAGGAVADSFFVISGSGQRWSSGGRGDR